MKFDLERGWLKPMAEALKPAQREDSRYHKLADRLNVQGAPVAIRPK